MIDAALAKNNPLSELADELVVASAVPASATKAISAASRSERFVLVVNVRRVDGRRVGGSMLMKLLKEIKAQAFTARPKDDWGSLEKSFPQNRSVRESDSRTWKERFRSSHTRVRYQLAANNPCGRGAGDNCDAVLFEREHKASECAVV
jgi:hypothetical protein